MADLQPTKIDPTVKSPEDENRDSKSVSEEMNQPDETNETSGATSKPKAKTKGTKQKKSSKDTKRSALQATKKKERKRHAEASKDVPVFIAGLEPDPQPAKHKGTGLVYDDLLLKHVCPLGSEHGETECPERLSACFQKLQGSGLLDRCVRVATRSATDDEILSFHSQEYLDTLKTISHLSPDELRSLAERYDSVFLCVESFAIAQKCTGGILNLVHQVVEGKLTNGFAVTRPPGHHAHHDAANGYCLLNNVGLAAKIARTKWNVERVMIVDWDVHHGQGVQFSFEDDPSVLYFSIHRYENKSFWPHLEESNFNHIGQKSGRGYNINVPWNKIGMSDAEYLTVFQQVLLPVAYEFNPELLLVCAGFDAAAGDPKGGMSVSVDCFSHLTHQLMRLAGGKVVLCLEGGYSLQALGDCVASCTQTLLGDPCVPLPPAQGICDSAVETLTNVTEALQHDWDSLRCNITTMSESDEEPVQVGEVSSTTRAGGDVPEVTKDVPEVTTNVPQISADVSELSSRLEKELTLSRPPNRTGLVFDERMKLHRAYNHPERPERISRIFSKHQELGLADRCYPIKSRRATDEELAMCHNTSLVADVQETSTHTARELIDIQEKFNLTKYSRDVYIHPDTYLCATLAAGCCFNLVDAVLTNQVLNAVGIIRPPGHHAEPDRVAGFCIFNNVALAAKYAQSKYGVKRILIVDWDVHHGNGTQAILEDDPSMMYISVHRHDDGMFYPPGPEGGADRVGKGVGKGYNINIAWNTDCMGGVGDAEYLAAFQRVIMPVAYQFAPELVFISAGFDAAKGDPLGGCKVSPECYGHMTQLLSSLAGGRLITVLEGGYNLHSISVSMAMCTGVMLGDLCCDLSPGQPSSVGMQAIYETAKAHQSFWPSMKLQVLLLETMLVGEGVTAKEEANLPITTSQKVVMSPAPPEEKTETGSSDGWDGEWPDESSMVPVVGVKEGKDAVACLADGLSQMTMNPNGGGGDDTENVNTDQGACGGCAPKSGQGDLPSSSGISDIVSNLVQTFGPEAELHAVVPLPWCPHLESHVQPLPPGGLDVGIPCKTCDDPSENWVCLDCYQVHCGRYVNEHMLFHGIETGHLLVLSYADLSVWCYGCDAYVHNEIVIPAKQAGHLSKFGTLPGM